MRSKAQTKTILAYLARMKATLCLSDWVLRVLDDEFAEYPALASIEPVTGRKLAYLRLCKDFCGMSAEEQSHALAHELMHLHHVNANDVVRVDLRGLLSQAEYDVIYSTYKRQHEYANDEIARSFVKLIPLISYPDKKKKKAHA